MSNLLLKYNNAKIMYCGDFNARVGCNNSIHDDNIDMLELSEFSPDRSSED